MFPSVFLVGASLLAASIRESNWKQLITMSFSLLFCLCCAFCFTFASDEAECNDQDYNNAWKILDGFESGYIKYVTFDISTRCVSVKKVSQDDDTHTAVYAVTQNTEDDPTFQHFNMTIIGGSPCLSSLGVSYDGGTTEAEVADIVYTDYQYCSFDRYPEQRQNCRYWVRTGATEEQSEVCEEYFNKECGTKRILVYDETSCGADVDH